MSSPRTHNEETTPLEGGTQLGRFQKLRCGAVVTAIHEPPARSPPRLDCFLLKPGPRLHLGLNFPPVVLTQI